MFQLTKVEFDNLISKNLTSSWGGRRKLPKVFTEQGVYPDCKIELKQTGKKYHDRYIVIDYGTEQEKIFHCGPSSKDGGLRIGSIVEIREREAYHTLVNDLLKMPELQL